jgi:hypothetical protein
VYRVSASLVYEEDFLSPDSNTWEFDPYLFGTNQATAVYAPQPGRLENRPQNSGDIFPKLEGVLSSFILNGRVTAVVNIYAPYRSDRGAGVRHRDRLLVLFRQNDSSCATGKAAWVGVGTISGGNISIDSVMRQRLGCINSSSTPYTATLTIESSGSTMRTYVDGNLLWEFTNTYSYGYAGVCLSYPAPSTPPGDALPQHSEPQDRAAPVAPHLPAGSKRGANRHHQYRSFQPTVPANDERCARGPLPRTTPRRPAALR